MKTVININELRLIESQLKKYILNDKDFQELNNSVNDNRTFEEVTTETLNSIEDIQIYLLDKEYIDSSWLKVGSKYQFILDMDSIFELFRIVKMNE